MTNVIATLLIFGFLVGIYGLVIYYRKPWTFP